MTSKEVESAVGAAPTQHLEERAARLRTAIADRQRPERELAALEAQIAARDAAALQAEAAARVKGIRSAVGSLAVSAHQDDVRLLAVAREYETAMAILNERFVKVRALQHEAASLAEAFDLPAPEFPAVVVPCTRRDVVEAQGIVAQAQPRESLLLSPSTDRDGRRTYEELAGTEGGKLIARKLG